MFETLPADPCIPPWIDVPVSVKSSRPPATLKNVWCLEMDKVQNLRLGTLPHFITLWAAGCSKVQVPL